MGKNFEVVVTRHRPISLEELKVVKEKDVCHQVKEPEVTSLKKLHLKLKFIKNSANFEKSAILNFS